ncbi:GNAT family N-acetyltransferase [Pedobacter sp. KR3-3]|uniref:GNAT family N-acetyltransferase n=1 Tax=Pedobacter albus TaxID=3113905 RepID=A0ABU7IBG4_9SPHI|nr:GNAT family N-acetyltransferase [Pedobacter sp. KR3-3]MEE1946509.1 GNAT family N-acetyltransferase [Pedobacter sp. KR3-3]
MELNWIYKNFDDLSVTELYAILQLRSEVFVVEQNCVYLDIDNKDKKSMHLMAWQGDDLAAYTRLVPPGVSFAEASIGRVVTSPRYRGTGIGIELMQKSIVHCLATYQTQNIRIGAQLYLQKFYTNLGFVQNSEPYDEDGIPHIEMILSKP